MRSLIIVVVVGVLLWAIPAKSEEDIARIRVTGEVGYVFLTDSEDEMLENALAYGVSAGYRLMPYMEVRLPVLYSVHGGKDLPSGTDAELSLLSVTPGLAFSTTGRLSFWFFVGGGVTFVSSEMDYVNLSISERDVAGASCMSGGLDLSIIRSLSVGAGGSIFTATREVEQYDGSEDWETTVYYAAVGRLTYAF